MPEISMWHFENIKKSIHPACYRRIIRDTNSVFRSIAPQNPISNGKLETINSATDSSIFFTGSWTGNSISFRRNWIHDFYRDDTQWYSSLTDEKANLNISASQWSAKISHEQSVDERRKALESTHIDDLYITRCIVPMPIEYSPRTSA